jgi:hypothetical protein
VYFQCYRRTANASPRLTFGTPIANERALCRCLWGASSIYYGDASTSAARVARHRGSAWSRRADYFPAVPLGRIWYLPIRSFIYRERARKILGPGHSNGSRQSRWKSGFFATHFEVLIRFAPIITPQRTRSQDFGTKGKKHSNTPRSRSSPMPSNPLIPLGNMPRDCGTTIALFECIMYRVRTVWEDVRAAGISPGLDTTQSRSFSGPTAV